MTGSSDFSGKIGDVGYTPCFVQLNETLTVDARMVTAVMKDLEISDVYVYMREGCLTEVEYLIVTGTTVEDVTRLLREALKGV